MPQVRRRSDLAQETLRPQGGGQFRTQHLHGDFPAVLEILRLVDDRHPPRAEGALEVIPTGKGGLKRGRYFGQVSAQLGSWNWKMIRFGVSG